MVRTKFFSVRIKRQANALFFHQKRWPWEICAELQIGLPITDMILDQFLRCASPQMSNKRKQAYVLGSR